MSAKKRASSCRSWPAPLAEFSTWWAWDRVSSTVQGKTKYWEIPTVPIRQGNPSCCKWFTNCSSKEAIAEPSPSMISISQMSTGASKPFARSIPSILSLSPGTSPRLKTEEGGAESLFRMRSSWSTCWITKIAVREWLTAKGVLGKPKSIARKGRLSQLCKWIPIRRRGNDITNPWTRSMDNFACWTPVRAKICWLERKTLQLRLKLAARYMSKKSKKGKNKSR